MPIFEDPSRTIGKRDYIDGDSMRRVDWKASAASSRLQVKIFEPSIALESVIFLNLNSDEYTLHNRFDAPELAIIVASSILNWVINRRQSAGLTTNGIDPHREHENPLPIPARRGRGHLMRMLDILARVKTGGALSFVDLLRRQIIHQPWGTSLVLITSTAEDNLFDTLFQARKVGLDATIILCGLVDNWRTIQRRAETFHFPIFLIEQEKDLERWK
jgi:uncharacterized protein (DUF58 family)